MPESRKVRWWTSPRALLREILQLDDTRHSIALGTAIGMFIGMTPTVGLQMILVVLVGIVAGPFLRFNRPAALLTVYVSNPITLVPIYWFDYKIGTLFFGGRLNYEDIARELGPNGTEGAWHRLTRLFVEIGAPLVVGSLLAGGVAAALTYPAMLWLLGVVRRRQPSGANGGSVPDSDIETDEPDDGSDGQSAA